MSHPRVHNDRIEVHLTPAEKSLALRSDDIVVHAKVGHGSILPEPTHARRVVEPTMG